MRTPIQLIIDAWTALTYKPVLEGENKRQVTWMTTTDLRRSNAYTMLQAYDRNASRYWLADEHQQDNRREYGDASLIVSTTLAAVMGDEQHVIVPDADRYETDLPADATDEQRAANAALKRPFDIQELLREWAAAEGLIANLQLGERNAVGLGDNVYTLRWSAAKQRPRLSVWHPGTYFPVLNDDGSDAEDFPTTVHFAWEQEGPDRGKNVLYRQTWELGPIVPATETQFDENGRARRRIALDSAEQWMLVNGSTWDPVRGVIVRSYPWQTSDDEASAVTCYYSEGWWSLDKDGAATDTVYDLDPSKANWVVRNGEVMERVDLGIDFLPVVHLPNNVAGRDHFGQSSLNPVLQLIDDLQAADTDVQASSATTGHPVVGVSGVNLPTRATDDSGEPPTFALEPGRVWGLGQDGKLTALDTSPMLTAGHNYVDKLLDRLSRNARLPGALLGTVDPAQVASGFALSLSFGPLQSMIAAMRLTRSEKYPLLLKFVQRMYINENVLTGETVDAELTLGAFVPSDRDMEIDRIVKLRAPVPPLVSLETAIRMLVEVGVPVEDIQEEIDKIEKRAFDAAVALVDATGSTEDARTFLQLEPAPSLAPPTVTLPGALGNVTPPNAGA